MEQKVRNSIKAIIIQDDKILTIKCTDQLGEFYLLPGGGQDKGELMPDTLKRECLEEIGCDVDPGRLLYIREYLADNHEFAEFDKGVHQIEFMFECSLVEGSIPKNGPEMDPYQIGIEWLSLDDLMNHRLYPQTLRAIIIDRMYEGPIYLGDIN
ncbi:MAG: NUDIX domain-containing protein [Candidatus Zophobacter franzmannii]|nr:NUDIX domain-containing protein [Candidatus Zophobacter franzmannii]